MKAIKVIIGVVLAALLLLLVLAFILPSSAQVQRSAIIDAEMEQVFVYMNDLQRQNSWSPWLARDKGMAVEYSGPPQGVGAMMAWDSEIAEVGSGTQTIVASQPNEYVESELTFDDAAGGRTRFDLAPAADGVRVTWSYVSEFGNNPVARLVGLKLESTVAPHLEAGLSALKSAIESSPAITTEEIRYEANGTQLQGYIAYPENAKDAPGVLVVHEWWGHNDYVRMRADMLAELGYVAFAVDMYGEGKLANHPKEANAFMMEVINGADAAQVRFTKALELLKGHPASDPNKTAAIGYCFGGAVVLSMARAGVELDAVVSFHGSLAGLAPINEGEVTADFLVLNGADDPMVTEQQKQAFKQEMDSAELDYQFVDYPGAVHAFTNPDATEKGETYNLPLAYDAEADADSWAKMKSFLAQVF